MKSLQLLLCLTPLACLLGQTPPPSKTITLPPPAGQPAADKPPTVTLSTEKPSAPAPAPAAKPVPPDTVVLTIGDQKITAADFDHMVDMIPEQYRAQARSVGKRQFADNIVRLTVMAQEARRRNLDQTQAYKDQVDWQTENLLAQTLYKELSTNTKIDEATAKAYYDQHKSDYIQVKASHILIRFKGSPVPAGKDKDGKERKELTEEEALAKAKEIRAKLAAGGDFSAIAKTESFDVGSASNGGDLGLFGHGRMVPAFEEVAFALPIGEISEPVKSQFGYHIIKVLERKEKTFEEARPEIDKKLPTELAQKTMDNLKTAANVVMNPEYFGPVPAPAAAVKAPTAPPHSK
jgi:peptidyl-prolyl cis-trans isomerase C